MKKLNIGFIGLGLIGGSIAKGIRKNFPETIITVYNRSENSRIAAYNDGIANIITDSVDDNFKDCDYIFLCTPVEHNIVYLDILKNIIKPDCIITDVGSVKTNIHEEIEKRGLNKNFIGGHPMTGLEKTSYFNSDEKLMINAYYIFTPTPDSDPEKLTELKNIISAIGSKPVILDYKEHDYLVAGISHVPHLIAANLVNLVKDTENENMKLLAAGGFKDITRIASSSPQMWQEICSVNSENIIKLLDKYILMLNETKEELQNSSPNAIYKLFEKSKEYRDSF